MKNPLLTLAGPGAIALTIGYQLIPFLILGGASDALAKVRPLLLSVSMGLLLLGLVQRWHGKHLSSGNPTFSSTLILVFRHCRSWHALVSTSDSKLLRGLLCG
jgi:hypothetical protein